MTLCSFAHKTMDLHAEGPSRYLWYGVYHHKVISCSHFYRLYALLTASDGQICKTPVPPVQQKHRLNVQIYIVDGQKNTCEPQRRVRAAYIRLACVDPLARCISEQ